MNLRPSVFEAKHGHELSNTGYDSSLRPVAFLTTACNTPKAVSYTTEAKRNFLWDLPCVHSLVEKTAEIQSKKYLQYFSDRVQFGCIYDYRVYTFKTVPATRNFLCETFGPGEKAWTATQQYVKKLSDRVLLAVWSAHTLYSSTS